jgi:ATP-dependent Clp protease ATP-binding subunit ClpX
MEHVRLTFAKEALNEVAKSAITRKTGARGLRAILENVLLDTMYDLPSQPNLEEVVINANTIAQGQEPLKIFTDTPREHTGITLTTPKAEAKKGKKAS